MTNMEIVLAEYGDVERIMEIVADAQRWFASQGIDQWQDGYPTDEIFRRDIEHGECYVVREGEDIIAVGVISFRGEPTYATIYDGAWLNDAPYVVVHRIAVRSRYRGSAIAGRILAFAEKLSSERGVTQFRIDTHRDNRAMLRVVAKFGFKHCGSILLESGAAREAFQKRVDATCKESC